MEAAQHAKAHEAFRNAIKIAGGQAAFHRATGLLQQTASLLLKKGRLCPAEFVLKAEETTGVSRYDLRPDIYPRGETPPVGAPAVAGDRYNGAQA